MFKLKLVHDYDVEEAYLKTLKWVNKQRIKQNLPTLGELAQGERASAIRCPLARSLEGNCVMVGPSYITIYDSINKYKLLRMPSYARAFIEYFDEDYYPDLAVERSELVQ